MAEDVVEEDDASAAHDLDNSRPLCFEGHCRGTGRQWVAFQWPLLTYLKGMGHNGTESFL